MKNQSCIKIIEVMKRGGFYDNVMSGGSDFDRLKDYLLAFEGKKEIRPRLELQAPTYPCFPGLRHKGFHNSEDFKETQILEEGFSTIRNEAMEVANGDYFKYRPHVIKAWTLYLLYYMGVNLDFDKRCNNILKLLRSVPNLCVDYPWGDALLSMHGPGAHLPAHCSIDSVRVRIHLGISIPDESEIRVGRENRQWEEGKCIVFDDSIEHEVWNRSEKQRLVLILDLWHPDLTELEREVLTAGFRKSEVREVFYDDRIKNTSAPQSYLANLKEIFAQQDNEPLIRKYWS